MEILVYSFRKLRGIWFVIHNETGCSYPYNNGKTTADYSNYKYDCFSKWVGMSRSARKRMKKEYLMSRDCKLCEYAESVRLGTLTAKTSNEKQLEKEKVMRYCDDCGDSFALTPEQRKQEYLVNRLEVIEGDKNSELRKAFNIEDEDPPQTTKELAERLKEGRYEIKDADKDREIHFYQDASTFLRWRDPKKPADKKGYEEASKLLSKAMIETTDNIVVLPPEEGLKALKDFEAQTFH